MDKTQVQKIENMFNHACARAHANVGHAMIKRSNKQLIVLKKKKQ